MLPTEEDALRHRCYSGVQNHISQRWMLSS